MKKVLLVCGIVLAVGVTALPAFGGGGGSSFKCGTNNCPEGPYRKRSSNLYCTFNESSGVLMCKCPNAGPMVEDTINVNNCYKQEKKVDLGSICNLYCK